MNALERARKLIDEAYEHSDRWEWNYADAESLLREVVRTEPQSIDALTCLGAVLCDGGKFKEAIPVLKEAVRLGSQDSNTYFNLGVATINTATQKQALVFFRKAQAFQASPLSWKAYFDPQAH